MLKILLLMVSGVALLACSKDNGDNKFKSISASACAAQLSNGAVVECETDYGSQKELSNLHEIYRSIDEKFPGPVWPDVTRIDENQLYQVISITEDNAIVVDSGARYYLAGVKCNQSDTYEFLNKTLIRANTKVRIAVQKTGFDYRDGFYAYIWDFTWFSGSSGFGPALSSTNEALVTSGYCVPIEQTNHNYYSRYVELSKIAR